MFVYALIPPLPAPTPPPKITFKINLIGVKITNAMSPFMGDIKACSG